MILHIQILSQIPYFPDQQQNRRVVSIMEYEVSIEGMSIDEIANKIKAFRNNEQVMSVCLLVRRRTDTKSCIRPQKKSDDTQEIRMSSMSESSQKIYMPANLQDQVRIRKMKQSEKLYNKGNYEESLQLLQELYEHERYSELDFEQERERKLANISFKIGNCYYRLGMYDKAIEYYSQEYERENIKQKGSRKFNLGSSYAYHSNPQLSLKYFNQALQIYSNFDEIDKSNLYYNVGLIYLKQKMYENAHTSFTKSLQQRKVKSPQNQIGLANAIEKLGITLKYEGKYAQSINNLQSALHYAERGLGNVVRVKKQIASVYESMREWRKALTCYESLLNNHGSEQVNMGWIYEKAALICWQLQQRWEWQKNIKLSIEYYRKEGNSEKVEGLCRYSIG